MLVVTSGDDRTVTFTIKTAAGAAYDLTGCTVFATVKRNTEDADASALISDSLTVSAPATGVAVWTIEAADTLYMLGLYKYDIQLKNSSNKIETILTDDFKVEPQVTIRTS